MATTAVIASFRQCRTLPSFPHRHGQHRSAQAFRVQCAVESTSNDSTSKSGGAGNPKHVDTRIHWANESDGWIGIDESDDSAARSRGGGGLIPDYLTRPRTATTGVSMTMLCRYLGVSADAEVEEIKSAYRRLSKLYHPDSTQLPIEIAAQKFMRLKDAYDTLSSQELRNLYDSRLATNIVSNTEGNFYGYPISSQQGYDMKSQKRPERVDSDTLGGRNMPLSGQAASALAFDFLVLVICIFVIIFTVYFKGHAST